MTIVWAFFSFVMWPCASLRSVLACALMSGVSTHVLDLAKGQPAVGLPVLLEVKDFPGAWKLLTKG
jgi:hypothetical protein